ncbi:hypothetical protein A3203_32710 [Burkholderia cenocepacia]|uniref:hypothetical protein n=1 Tax=Burkholderia cenocepacia TaxID=95486 RepID=UPI00078D6ABB|nr:hypothetical protein [Burkholderia cenocepacia]AMU17539.1 hypothetical protein A3203_32710 [Burkholderia cenocepacia]
MNADEARFWAHKVLPPEASAILRRAAEEVKDVADPTARANRIDFAIYMVRTSYPDYFKE